MCGYTRRRFRAVVEALVPRTPELESSHGQAYVPGGRDVALEEYVMEAFDNYQEHHLGRPSTLLRLLGVRNYPYAVVVAALLDVVAVELLVRRRNHEAVDRSPSPRVGPFERLSPTDRLRAIELLEEGILGTLADRFGDRIPHLGMVRFLAMGLNTFPLLGYYSEWSVDDGMVQGWEQTGYPGAAAGYTAHCGYEIERFEE